LWKGALVAWLCSPHAYAWRLGLGSSKRAIVDIITFVTTRRTFIGALSAVAAVAQQATDRRANRLAARPGGGARLTA
jgi:hypothetical protein